MRARPPPLQLPLVVGDSLWQAKANFQSEEPDELSFRIGDILVIPTGQQTNGHDWVEGRSNETGRAGYVPVSYLGRIEHARRQSVAALPKSTTSRPRAVTALHNFKASSADEITIRKGDVVFIQDSEDPGYWQGDLNGMVHRQYTTL